MNGNDRVALSNETTMILRTILIIYFMLWGLSLFISEAPLT